MASRQGHPKRPLERDSIPGEDIVGGFLSHTCDEEPALYRYLKDLDETGQNELAGILGRFDFNGSGLLEAEQRLQARRILIRLHRPSSASLTITNKILDYLDLNCNSVLEAEEQELCIEIMELFARADSDNDTLSEKELEMLYAVLRFTDKNNNRKLDANERQQLRQSLTDPEKFLNDQRESNPLLKDI